jgi:hypothetical protein
MIKHRIASVNDVRAYCRRAVGMEALFKTPIYVSSVCGFPYIHICLILQKHFLHEKTITEKNSTVFKLQSTEKIFRLTYFRNMRCSPETQISLVPASDPQH